MATRTTVMLVDSDTLFRHAVSRLFAESDDVTCGWLLESSEQAIESIARGAKPDIILMDVNLPGMSGIEGLIKIKELQPDTDIIIVTAREEDDSIFKAFRAGAAGYILKDDTLDDVIGAVRVVREGGASINTRVARRIVDRLRDQLVTRSDYGLTDRERQILGMLAKGLTKKRIAGQLYLSYHTIDTHIKNIYIKLQVNTRSGAVAKALRENLI